MPFSLHSLTPVPSHSTIPLTLSLTPSIAILLLLQQILRQFSVKDILRTERHEESASVTIKLRDTQFTFLLEDRLAFGELVHILDGCEEYRSWRVSLSLTALDTPSSLISAVTVQNVLMDFVTSGNAVCHSIWWWSMSYV